MNGEMKKRYSYWFGFWGAALAWLGHFLFAYGIGEFGCVANFAGKEALGMSLVSWLLVLIAVLFFAIGVFSCRVALSNFKNSKDQSEAFSQKSGFILGLVFTSFILFQSVPVFFFLKKCG